MGECWVVVIHGNNLRRRYCHGLHRITYPDSDSSFLHKPSIFFHFLDTNEVINENFDIIIIFPQWLLLFGVNFVHVIEALPFFPNKLN